MALLRPLFTTILLASRSMFTVYEVFLLLVGAASSGRMLPRVGLRLNKICDVVLKIGEHVRIDSALNYLC